MNDEQRKQYRNFITANSDFEESDVEEMGDAVLEQTHEIVAEAATDADGDSTDDDDDDDDPGADGGDDDKTIADMTPAELGEELRDQGFVTEDNAGDFVQEAQAQATKSEMVDEIIAQSEDYEEDDREDLMASADKVVNREHDRVTGASASQVPGNAGLTAGVTPSSTNDGDEDLDEYGTGTADP